MPATRSGLNSPWSNVTRSTGTASGAGRSLRRWRALLDGDLGRRLAALWPALSWLSAANAVVLGVGSLIVGYVLDVAVPEIFVFSLFLAVLGAKKGADVVQTITATLDMRGKTISTYVAFAVVSRLADLAEGETVELITDASDALDNDIHAWSRTTGHEVVGVERGDREFRYVICKHPPRRSGRRFAAVISDPGLEELLSPLGFALSAALEGVEVSLYFQGPAVRVLTRGFVDRLRGPSRPFSRFARSSLNAIGHIPAQEKIAQLQRLGAHLYACGPSMEHFKVRPVDLAFAGVTIAEYLTFMEVMANADIHIYV